MKNGEEYAHYQRCASQAKIQIDVQKINCRFTDGGAHGFATLDLPASNTNCAGFGQT
jgi:hypothetical protein